MKKLCSLFIALTMVAYSYATISLSPTTIANGLTGHVYSQTFTASGGSGNYIYTKMSGTLPTGYILGLQNGVLSGTCIVAGSYTFRIRATGRSNDTISKSYTMTVPNVTLTTTSQVVNIWRDRYVPNYSGLYDTWNNYLLKVDTIHFAGPTSAWMLAGNAVAANSTLGNTSNFAVLFKTNNLERMRLLNTGNLGIGTSTPATKLDVTGAIRATGTTGAATGIGTELYASGLKSFDYSVGVYTNQDLDGLGLSFSNQGNIVGNITGTNFLMGGSGLAGAKLEVKGADNLGTYALKVGGSTNTDILNVRNNGYVGINTTNNYALSVTPRPGQTGQFISYSPGFRVAMSISDDDATTGSVNFGTGAMMVDVVNNIVGIGASAQVGNKLYIKESTASAIPFYIASQNGSGLHLLGYTSNNPYYRQDNSAGVVKTVINAGGISYFNGGNVGFQQATASAYIHIGAGTATAGTGALKFDTGTLNTVQEAGAVECANDNLYYTENSTLLRTQLAKSLSNSATLDFPNTNAGVAADLTITVTGSVEGDVVSVGVPNSSMSADNISFWGWVSANGTVTVRFNNNNTAAAVNPASGTFKVTVIKN